MLAKAVRRFSTHGYHATSVGDLEQCMGIHRASIYDTFGSKRGLFVSALRFYIERYEARLRGIVDQATHAPGGAPGRVHGGGELRPPRQDRGRAGGPRRRDRTHRGRGLVQGRIPLCSPC